MSPLTRVLLWLPRVMTLVVALFLSMFAMNVYFEGMDFLETSGAIISRFLPSLCVISILVMGWRREELFAIVFVVLAVAFFVALSGWSNPLVVVFFTLPPLGIGLACFARMRLLVSSAKEG